MAITKWKSKHNGKTMSEGKCYLNLLNSIYNGKWCGWTVAPTELPWIRFVSV